MNAIDTARHMIEDIERSDYKAVDMIVIHPTLSARNYVFGIEMPNGKVVLLANALDWQRAVMEYITSERADDIDDELFWTPVVTEEKIAQVAIGGIYKWICKLESPTPQRK